MKEKSVGALLLWLLLCSWASAASVSERLKFDAGRKGLASVSDPTASQSRAVAVDVSGESGKTVLVVPVKTLPAGLYQVRPRLRLYLPAEYEAARLKLNFQVLVEGKVLASLPLNWPLFDASAGAYTEFERDFSLESAGTPVFELHWNVTALPVGAKPRALLPTKGPSIDEANKESAGKKGKAALSPVGDVLGDLDSDVAVALSKIAYPAVLADNISVQPQSTSLIVEKVWPQKVHVYPGETNPVEVVVRNYQAQPQKALVRLEVCTGLSESSPPQEVELLVPPKATIKHQFPWTAGVREYGHEARVTLSTAGKEVHRVSEYFSVGAPIWKTALQAPGFLTWFGREEQLVEHVHENRQKYLNVEEAFSWQPSSWTDLNPAGDDWWTGQGNAHNSLRGLKLWRETSRSHGIKLITYSWPSASGPSGLEWGRRHPDLATHSSIGLSSEFHDVEDLKLYEILHTNPSFKGLHYGVWHGFGVNLGRMEAINLGAEEIIRSALKFGWDGVRFDHPPGWSEMGAAEMHRDFERLGISAKMATLVPEFFGVKEGNWSQKAVSVRNIRWFKHRFETDIGPHFALSYNFGLQAEPEEKRTVPTDFFSECARNGGQMMNEAIRLSNSWETYRKTALYQGEMARQNGGYDTIFCPDKAPQWLHPFAAIFTFASGSHPYGGYSWGAPMPGNYTQFMTRFGEFCWDLALAPTTAAAAGISVQPESKLLWKDYLRQRTLPNGEKQTIVHLVSPPPTDAVVPSGKNGELLPWQRNVKVRKAGGGKPVVWLLSAEPRTRAEVLTAQPDGDGFAVTVPEHRYWSLLVWTEEKPK